MKKMKKMFPVKNGDLPMVESVKHRKKKTNRSPAKEKNMKLWLVVLKKGIVLPCYVGIIRNYKDSY